LRKGYGTKPAFTVPPRMEASACRQAHQQLNRGRTVPFERPWDRPTNDIVETI
jgi:hypothetical protein